MLVMSYCYERSVVDQVAHGNMVLDLHNQHRLWELAIHQMALEQSLEDSIMSEMAMQHSYEVVCIMKLRVVVM